MSNHMVFYTCNIDVVKDFKSKKGFKIFYSFWNL